MKKEDKLKIGIVKPPIGNKFRGIGTYTCGMIDTLKQNKKILIKELYLGQEKAEFDIIHYPYFDPFFLTLPLRKKSVTFVTVHDLIPLKFPKYFPSGIRGKLKWLIQKKSIKSKDLIITDSFASKKDIKTFLGESVEIEVVYPGVNSVFHIIKSAESIRKVNKKYKLPEEFILYVGDINYNKNIVNLIKAYSKLRYSINIDLVMVGKAFEQKSPELQIIQRLIENEGLKSKIHQIGYIPESDLVHIYNRAFVYLQPSLAEGFGLPVLEAMSCGVPVVTSNTSSLFEIVGNIALTVNPLNIAEISDSLEKLLKDKELRNKMIHLGLKRVKMFNWNNFSMKMVHLYKQYSI